jgi:dipeptidyl aminopeptidase/acylaminoacyl peptidase
VKKLFLIIIISTVSLAIGWFARGSFRTVNTASLPTPIANRIKPLEKYSIDNLAIKDIQAAQFSVGREITEDGSDYNSYIFYLKFDPTLSGGEEKNVSGVLNVPKGTGPFPLVFLIRGYVDQTIYTSGIGTKNAAGYFAEDGYATVSPDFLGYAESDTEAGNIFESRFQTYTTALTLLKTIEEGSVKLENNNIWDRKNLFIWAHSNGGQIALTLLAATQENIPTTLWAPVTKPFPYSVLYYTDESVDGGKFIRRELAKFENDYDVDKFSFTNYLHNVNASIELHQGTADDAVPVEWSSSFVNKLKKLDKDIQIYKYPGADHNLRPSWDTAIEQSLGFFDENIK